MKKPVLMNAVNLSGMHPLTFKIPDYATRYSMNPGDFAKIGLRFSKTDDGMEGERFWVEILKKINHHMYIGKIKNSLVFKSDHGYDFGDEIQFSAQDIMDVLRKPKNS